MTPQRARVLAELADSIVAANATRVAIDGRSAAGKSTLADELEPILEARDDTLDIGDAKVKFIPGGPQGRPELHGELFI